MEGKRWGEGFFCFFFWTQVLRVQMQEPRVPGESPRTYRSTTAQRACGWVLFWLLTRRCGLKLQVASSGIKFSLRGSRTDLWSESRWVEIWALTAHRLPRSKKRWKEMCSPFLVFIYDKKGHFFFSPCSTWLVFCAFLWVIFSCKPFFSHHGACSWWEQLGFRRAASAPALQIVLNLSRHGTTQKGPVKHFDPF